MLVPEFDLDIKQQVWIGDLPFKQKEELIRLVEECYGVEVQYKRRLPDATSLNHEHGEFNLHDGEDSYAEFKSWESSHETVELQLEPSRVVDLDDLV